MINKTDIVKALGLNETKLDPFEDLISQVKAEYDLCWNHQKVKKDEWGLRLKLYNNQQRDKELIGDTTMFTIHQTILASLYMDKLTAVFGAREQGDEEVAENLNAMAANDYDEMEKDILDYFWDWDTLFFGHALVDLSEYVREPEKGLYLPSPRGVDPLVFLHDPRAVLINGDMNRRAGSRFHGWEEKMSKSAIKDHSHMFEVKFDDIHFGSGTHSLLKDSIEAHDRARGTQTQQKETESKLGANAEYDITKWHTHFEIDGKVKKIIVWLANDRTMVIGAQVLKENYWKMLDRLLYPTSNDWDGTSIPDITEDKQRARSIAQNLGLMAMKSDLYPSYIYDSNRITNRNDLTIGFNKFIPMNMKTGNVNDAIAPLVKAHPNMQLMNFILDSLDVSAQKATATPEIQQGTVSEQQRTLGELNLISSKVDTRYSLSAKIFGWSEKRFWQMWYQCYKDNFADTIDKKVLRIEGAFGAKWRPLTKENIVTPNIDPDVKIESQVLSRAKQLEERQALTNYFAIALQDPTINRRYAMKELARLQGMTKDRIDRLWPKTIDEREAEQENDQLNKGESVKVQREQDHNVHLEVHAKANDTPEARAHIKTHEKALMIRRSNPELFPQDMTQTAMNPPGTPGITPPGGSTAAPSPIAPSQTSNSPMN